MRLTYKDRYRCLGENISFYRRRQNMTQDVLAEMVDVESIHISRIETGARAPSLDLIFAIADALDVEPYILFQKKD